MECSLAKVFVCFSANLYWLNQHSSSSSFPFLLISHCLLSLSSVQLNLIPPSPAIQDSPFRFRCLELGPFLFLVGNGCSPISRILQIPKSKPAASWMRVSRGFEFQIWESEETVNTAHHCLSLGLSSQGLNLKPPFLQESCNLFGRWFVFRAEALKKLL